MPINMDILMPVIYFFKDFNFGSEVKHRESGESDKLFEMVVLRSLARKHSPGKLSLVILSRNFQRQTHILCKTQTSLQTATIKIQPQTLKRWENLLIRYFARVVRFTLKLSFR